MNIGGSIYILKGNFSLKLAKVLDPPFKTFDNSFLRILSNCLKTLKNEQAGIALGSQPRFD